MPVTGTLGALTYTKSTLGNNNWLMEFAPTDIVNNSIRFYAFDSLNNEFFIAAGINTPSNPNDPFPGVFPEDVNANAFILSVYTDSVPRIRYSQEYQRNQAIGNVNNINGVTETVIFNSPIFPNFANNQFVRFNGSGGNINTAQGYYLSDVSGANPSQCKLSLTSGGPTLNLTSQSNVFISMASLVPNTTSGQMCFSDVKFSIFDTTLKAGGFMQMIPPPITTAVLTTNYAELLTLDTDSNVSSSYRFLPRVTSNTSVTPTTQTVSTLPISSGNVITSQLYEFTPTSPAPGGNAFNVISRINNGNVVWQRTSASINLTNTSRYPFLIKPLSGMTSDGNIINAYTIRFGSTQSYALDVYRLNQTNGSTVWKKGILAGSLGGYDVCGVLTSLNVDSNNNIYVSIKETDDAISNYGTYGSFIYKMNGGAGIIFQNHYSLTSTSVLQIDDLYLDGTSDIYFVARGTFYDTGPIIYRSSTTMIVGKLDSSGNSIWCNKMVFDNPISIKTIGIKKYQDSLYILGENGNDNIGMLFKLPANGSIPGTGTYTIDNGISNYNITYSADSLIKTTSNLQFDSTTFANLSNVSPTEFSSAPFNTANIVIDTGQSRLS